MSDGKPTLTRRQAECLGWVERGASTKVMARAMGLSPATVDEHIECACRRLCVCSRHQAAASARRLGLLVNPPS